MAENERKDRYGKQNAPTPTQTKPQAKQGLKRNFKSSKRFTTDLFKLMPEDVIKHDSGYAENAHPKSHPNQFTKWPHTHPFRTYDRKGKRMEYSTPIAGHFHTIEWTPSDDPDTPPTIKSVSGPMVMGTRINPETGLKEQGPVPANLYDKHTHDIEYINSGEIVVSAMNTEAMAVINTVDSLTAPVEGVEVR